jgi:hypothetical protein
MIASPAALERRYRRLLWAYPGSYRRRHGAEIVTTLLDMAESGSGRPTPAQTLHLVACGVRQRFRLPAGRPLAVVAAVLAAIALGALGAAGGTWLGWQTAAPVRSGDQMRTLTAAIAGINPAGVPVYPWETAMNGQTVTTTATGRVSYSAERVRTGLISAGWRITTFTETTGGIVVDITKHPWVEVPTRLVHFTATKDGLALRGSSTTVVGGADYGVDAQMDQGLDVWAVETAAVRPLTIAGLLLGVLAGWLLTAALAYRVRQSGRAHRRAATALAATAFAAAVVPAFDLYCNLYQVLTYDSGAPNPYIVYGPNDQLPAGLVPAFTGIGLLALAAAVLIALRGAGISPDPTGQEPVAST